MQNITAKARAAALLIFSSVCLLSTDVTRRLKINKFSSCFRYKFA